MILGNNNLHEYRDEFEEIILREIIRRRDIPDILAESRERFPMQADFIESFGNKKALFCTRRSAKSFTGGLYMCREGLNFPQCNVLYLGLTRDSAKGIIWKDILKQIDQKHKLGIRFNEAALTATLPNGSIMYVTGIDVCEDEMIKLLGRKYKLVIIDEASMYTIDLKNLVYGVLDPAVTDMAGTICMLGTASNFPRGLFYDITTHKEKGWKLFEWTAHDNPYVANKWSDKLAEIARDRPSYMETPQFKQWYLNKWVIDVEKLVYKFSLSNNSIRILPHLDYGNWTFVLGVDTGWEDDSGFVLTAYNLNDPCLYVLSCYKSPRMTFDDVINKIENFNRTSCLNGQNTAPHKVIIDGANKQGVESMKIRSNIPFEYADKRDKETFIELLNNDFIQGKIKILDIPENRALIDEMAGLVWVTDGGKIKYPKKEHPQLPNHLCDAFLYAWRCGYHYASVPKTEKTVLYSRRWYEEQAQNIWEREANQLRDSSVDWSDQGNLGELG